MLYNADHSLSRGAIGDFEFELGRLKLSPPMFPALMPERGQEVQQQSAAVEVSDLRKALRAEDKTKVQVNRIAVEHEIQRQRLIAYDEQRRRAAVSTWSEEGQRNASDSAPIDIKSIKISPGLPAEFALYFQGFIAWKDRGIEEKFAARESWERVLALPENQRKYKSTWAAYMLGVAWAKENPDRAVAYFRKVRELRRKGFGDSLGLAAASLGQEARVELDRKNYEGSIELYLEQMAAGDSTAINSLRMVAEKTRGTDDQMLVTLARNPRARAVVTAGLLSSRWIKGWSVGPNSIGDEGDAFSRRWAKAAELAEVKDMDSAEALALIAYNGGHMDLAERWIKRAPGSPVAMWLDSKLLLRKGKLKEGAAILSRLTTLFPVVSGTNEASVPTRMQSLRSRTAFQVTIERELRGELGILQLTCGDYEEALRSMLVAGCWMDAAYIAERVLTVDELKSYVDRTCPAEPVIDRNETASETDSKAGETMMNLRYLLARRLAREMRAEEAKPYYPAEWQESIEALITQLRSGWDSNLPNRDRANALFAAAMIVRTNGMELVGTEVTPDWHIHGGNYEFGVTKDDRGPDTTLMAPVHPDELKRYDAHKADPDVRFHYRYQAASLAWEAARLLPDNDDLTAYVLWQGGCFLKSRDPTTADMFYKALVRRNRQTALGAAADAQRWFPRLDAQGQIVPVSRSESQTEESPAAHH